ncbi:MAG TPA: efflux RND transporter periplasmic adaptor subunit [Azospirillum sp.]|nr:efflux RND transporter periplasmic adaptor subunit [Azospirillum sp.]
MAPYRSLSGRFAMVAALSLALAVLPAAAQQPQQGAPPVTVATPLKHTVTDYDEYTGQFAPVEYVEVRARVSGYLNEINFTDGQVVNKGDLLFVIDPRPYENALFSAQAREEQANATLEFAKRQLARGGELRQKDYLAQSDYDTRLQQARIAEANLNVARAATRDAELNLEFTHITAPLGGRVGTHLVSVGNLIAGGGTNGTQATLLTTIVALDPIYFNFDMSESDYLAHKRTAAARLESGQLPVALRFGDDKDWTRQGKLSFVDTQIDRSAGTIRLRATLPNAGFFITPGAFGRIRLPASDPYEALLVPDAAVVTDQSRKIVMVAAEDGTVTPKPVVLGPLYQKLRVVRSGLKEDDKVVINGLMRVRPGSKVTPQPGQIELASQSATN